MEESTWTCSFQVAAKEIKKGDSWCLELDENLEPNQKFGWKKCIVKTSARFECTECGRGWSSNKVSVVCHMRLTFGQGVVKVRPSRQNCKMCSEAPMEKPSIDLENINILLRNLVEKIRMKCYHEDLGRRSRSFRRFEGNNPHEPAHCEACMQGICPRSVF